LLLTTLLGSAAPSALQGTLMQDEQFSFVLMEGVTADGTCAPGAFSSKIETGSLHLRADGTWSVLNSEQVVCPDGTVTTGSNPVGGTYGLATDGTLTLTLGPTEMLELAMRFDHGLITNQDGATISPGILVAVRQAASPPPVAGSYTVVRFVHENGPAGLDVVLELGTLTVGGGGAWTESGLRHTVTPTGTTDTTYSASGTLAAAADGTLLVQPGARNGAASADGELLFWAEDQGSDAGVTFAVRQGGAHTAAALGGRWNTTQMGTERDLGSGLPRAWGLGSQGSVDGVTGAATFTGTGAEISAAGITPFPVFEAGSLATDAVGALTWTSVTSPGPPFFGGLAQSESLAVIGDVQTPDTAEVILLWNLCVAPIAYGVGSPGTGGFVPELSALGGLPQVGNPGFALRVEQGVGGGAGLLLVTAQPAPGLPFAGGTLWVAGTPIVLQAFSLSGASGAAGAGSATIPLPLPGGASLIGADFHAQAVVLDSGATGGLAFTQGLGIEICE